MTELDTLIVRVSLDTKPLTTALKRVDFAGFARDANSAISDIERGFGSLDRSIATLEKTTSGLPRSLRNVRVAASGLRTALGFISGPAAIVSGISLVADWLIKLSGVQDRAAEAADRHRARLDGLRESASRAAERIGKLTGAAQKGALIGLSEADESARNDLIQNNSALLRRRRLTAFQAGFSPDERKLRDKIVADVDAFVNDPKATTDPEAARALSNRLRTLKLEGAGGLQAGSKQAIERTVDKFVAILDRRIVAQEAVIKNANTRRAVVSGRSASGQPAGSGTSSTESQGANVPTMGGGRFHAPGLSPLNDTLVLLNRTQERLTEAISKLGACCGNLGAPKAEAREPAIAATAPSTPVGKSLAAVKEKTGVLESALVQAGENIDVAFKQSFENIFKTGKFNFSRLKDAAIGSLTSILDNLAGNFADGLFSSLFGGGGGGFFAGLLGGVGKLFGFAGGGAVQPNLPVLVGERGPEIFVPPSAGSVIPNSRIGRGGPPVIVNMTNRFDVGLESVDSRIAQAAAPIAAQAVAAIEEARERDLR